MQTKLKKARGKSIIDDPVVMALLNYYPAHPLADTGITVRTPWVPSRSEAAVRLQLLGEEGAAPAAAPAAVGGAGAAAGGEAASAATESKSARKSVAADTGVSSLTVAIPTGV